jgi:DNA invertase Pin-like site-specific DNA recombinase
MTIAGTAGTAGPMSVGYARCSTDKQDLTAQRTALTALGVTEDRIYLDHGFTGTNRERPRLAEALAAVREGDTLITTKLDRLARSVPDARDIIAGLHDRGVRFQLGAAVYDWSDPMAKMFVQMLAVFAEFEADLIRMRTREGMARPQVRAKLKGRKPKLSPAQETKLAKDHDTGDYSIGDLAELFGVSRPTVYRALARRTAIVLEAP